MRWAVFAGLAFMIAAPVAASAQQRDWPAPIRTAFQAAVAECRESGGRPNLNDRSFAEAVELNGDGRPDYIVGSSVECEGASSGYCGSAGCQSSIYLSGPGGYRMAWEGYSQGSAYIPGSPGRVRIGQHGSSCGRAGADTCFGELVVAGNRVTYRAMPRTGVTSALWMSGSEGWRHDSAANVARIDFPGGGYENVTVRCGASGPEMAFALRADATLPRQIRARLLGNQAEAGVILRGAGRAWTAALDRNAIALLTGRSEDASLFGEDGVEADFSRFETIPLTGSTRAIRAALEGCASGNTSAGESTVVPTVPQPTPARPQPPRLGRYGAWIVAQTPEGRYFAHSSDRAGGVEAIGVTCDEGQPHLLTLIPPQRSRNVAIGLSGSGGRIAIPVAPRGGGYQSQRGQPTLPGLLSQGSAVAVTLNGRAVGSISLNGASEAMRAVLGSCWAG